MRYSSKESAVPSRVWRLRRSTLALILALSGLTVLAPSSVSAATNCSELAQSGNSLSGGSSDCYYVIMALFDGPENCEGQGGESFSCDNLEEGRYQVDKFSRKPWRKLGDYKLMISAGEAPPVAPDDPPAGGDGGPCSMRLAVDGNAIRGGNETCYYYIFADSGARVCEGIGGRIDCTDLAEGDYRVDAWRRSPWALIESYTRTVSTTSTPPGGGSTIIDLYDDFSRLDESKWEFPSWASSREYGGLLDSRNFKNDSNQCSIENGALRLEAEVIDGETRSCYMITKDRIGPGDNHNMVVEFRVDVSKTRAHGAWFGAWVSNLDTGAANDYNQDTGHEVDVLEYVPFQKPGFDTTSWIHPAVHDGFNRSASVAEGSTESGYFNTQTELLGNTNILDSGFHTYTLEWNKQCQVFSIDGNRYWTVSHDRPGKFWPYGEDMPTSQNHQVIVSMEVDSGENGRPNLWNHRVGDFQDNVSSSTPAVALVDSVSAVRKDLDTSICR